MRGFPKAIGSKQDMENLLAMPELADQAKAKLTELEGGSKVWVVSNKLTKAQLGLTSATQQVSIQVAADGKEERYQMEIQEDPQAPFARLDLSSLKQAEPVLEEIKPVDQAPLDDPKPLETKVVTEGVKDA